MTHLPAGRAAIAAIATALVLSLAGDAGAQTKPADVPTGDGVITGRVVHDPPGPVEGNLGVILYALSPSGEPGLRQTQTDASGAFRFEGVSSDPGVVYLIGTRVAGVPFGSRVVFHKGEKKRDVEIQVSDPIQDAAGVKPLEAQVRFERGCSHLRVHHNHTLENDTGRVVYVPPGARKGATPVLELLLPEQASAVESPLGDAVEGIERDGRTLRYWGPVYPGTSSFEFDYGVPIAPETRLRIGFPGGVPGVHVFTPLAGGSVRSKQLHEAGKVALASGGHNVQRAGAIPPGGELDLTVSLDPAPKTDIKVSEARLWLELDDAALDVSEEYRLQVPGKTPLESKTDAPLLCIDMPASGRDLRFSDEALHMGLSRDPEGALALAGPIPAGESNLALRYRIPAKPGPFEFTRKFGQDVSLLTVLIADTGLVPDAPRLHRMRPIRTEDRAYLHLEGFGIGADERVALELTPLPPRRGLPRVASVGFVLLAGLSSLLFLVAPLRSHPEPEGEAPSGSGAGAVSTERQALYRAIEALDEDFETGKLSQEDHARMRAELRARAVAQLQVERQAERAAETAPEPAAPVRRFCTSCGAKISPEYRFCAQCGARLETGSA